MKTTPVAILPAAVLALGSLALAAPAKYETYTKPVKLAPYLFEMSYSDYSADLSASFGGQGGMACSAVRNGNFYGRNLDFYYNDMAEVVVHMAAKEGRFASVAVCGNLGVRQADVERGLSEEAFLALPGKAFDGVNERGVAANINVVPADDTGPLTGTNPGKPRMHATSIVRFVLDRASTAAEAVKLLGDYDIFGSFGHYSMHFMINDEKETYIVEFIDNKLTWTKQNIMVNFYHTLPEVTPFGSGVERYGILKANYAEGATLDGMCKLMQRVKYSQAYDPATKPAWYSEFVMCKGPDGRKLTTKSPREDYAGVLADMAVKNANRTRENGAANGIWQTVHTSVYDIAARKLRLFVQEDYARAFEFGLAAGAATAAGK